MNERAKAIIDFWYAESSPEDHFVKDEKFDKKIKEKFFSDYIKATNNEYDEWQNGAKTCNALIILLDQFSRNLFRENKKSFEMDFKSKSIVRKAIDKRFLHELSEIENHFMLMPLLHSEEIKDHIYVHKLSNIYLKNHPQYRKIKKAWDRHTYVIKKFGRYPHRNEVLNRKSTNEEKQFLKEPNSSW